MQRRGPAAELRPAAERRFVAWPLRVRCERTVLLPQRPLLQLQRPLLPQSPPPGLGAPDCRADWVGQHSVQLVRRHCGRWFAAVAAPEPQRSAASARAASWPKLRQMDGRTAAAQGGALAPRATRKQARAAASQPAGQRAGWGHAQGQRGARRHAGRLAARTPADGARHAGPARRAELAPRCEEPARREGLAPDAARVPRARRVLRARRAVPALLLLLPYAVAPLRSSPLPRR